MKLELRNDELGVKFSIDLTEKKTKMFDNVQSQFQEFEVPKHKQFSYASFKRLFDDVANSVKGWIMVTVNPKASMVSTRERNIATRDQKRKEQKAHKLAVKAAKKNVANGNRNRLGAQKRAKKAKDNQTKQIKPNMLASIVNQIIYQG